MGRIINTQTTMKVSDEKWEKIFGRKKKDERKESEIDEETTSDSSGDAIGTGKEIHREDEGRDNK